MSKRNPRNVGAVSRNVGKGRSKGRRRDVGKGRSGSLESNTYTLLRTLKTGDRPCTTWYDRCNTIGLIPPPTSLGPTFLAGGRAC